MTVCPSPAMRADRTWPRRNVSRRKAGEGRAASRRPTSTPAVPARDEAAAAIARAWRRGMVRGAGPGAGIPTTLASLRWSRRLRSSRARSRVEL